MCMKTKVRSLLAASNLSSIAFAVSIGMHHALKNMLVPQVTIKWPNDIMSYSKKVTGILIENQLKQNKIVSSVIGIGLNVNEEDFENLPQATSILLATGKKHNLEEVLQLVSEGKTNREIAKALFLGEGTVRNYVSSILSKLGVNNRAEAAAYAVEHSLKEYIDM